MMNTISDKIVCETPTPGKKPTRIDRWKYELLRKTILELLPASGEGVLFSRLTGLVKDHLNREQLVRIGSLSWYTTTVKLDLEVKGEIYRIPGSTPQRLLRIK